MSTLLGCNMVLQLPWLGDFRGKAKTGATISLAPAINESPPAAVSLERNWEAWIFIPAWQRGNSLHSLHRSGVKGDLVKNRDFYHQSAVISFHPPCQCRARGKRPWDASALLSQGVPARGLDRGRSPSSTHQSSWEWVHWNGTCIWQ